MNKTLQEEGYYMADFEFKMLGFAYLLDKGSYFKALTRLSDFHKQLQNRENLIKIPEFKSKKKRWNFILIFRIREQVHLWMIHFHTAHLMNLPRISVAHLDALAKETGTPLQLKYPLKYLDAINTPEKLYTFLDDVSYVGWIGSKFPQTSYVFARSLLSSWNDEGVIVKNNLYSFTPEL